MKTWGEIVNGDVVEDKNGKQWIVHDANQTASDGKAHVTITDGTEYVTMVKPPDGPVLVVEHVPDTLIDMVGSVIATEETGENPAPGDGPRVYPSSMTGLKIRSHLYLVHKEHAAAQMEGSVEMIVAHDKLHENAVPIEHTHQ